MYFVEEDEEVVERPRPSQSQLSLQVQRLCNPYLSARHVILHLVDAKAKLIFRRERRNVNVLVDCRGEKTTRKAAWQSRQWNGDRRVRIQPNVFDPQINDRLIETPPSFFGIVGATLLGRLRSWHPALG
ncbi:homoserine O-acetyltransferase [Pseudozyma hubeiensis SY62]|uniref:Homoserine O-acetyltransferase n=1 Tax=Pseudozyma hubeiensis (strain SY62) TaxID=1305764 RepID=R9PDX2_PSEHS|nr:homoserine O-acetyltransferase [Pseudozyma hubeiensis SY62]GAC99437.1 homoserine O-acetyltransferase [Pseudozyma hubeiensis SY62]